MDWATPTPTERAAPRQPAPAWPAHPASGQRGVRPGGTGQAATLPARHVPRPGDTVETELGTLRVENMARRRITRVSVQLAPELLRAEDGES